MLKLNNRGISSVHFRTLHQPPRFFPTASQASSTLHPNHGLTILSQGVRPGVYGRMCAYRCTARPNTGHLLPTQRHLRTRPLEAQRQDAISIHVDESWILVSFLSV